MWEFLAGAGVLGVGILLGYGVAMAAFDRVVHVGSKEED